MSQVIREMTVCDICDRDPDGASPDRTLHYEPCGHDICNECYDYKKYGMGRCSLCGQGKDGYTK